MERQKVPYHQYPLALIDEKIKLVRTPREKATNDEEVLHNFKACFTGLRCDSIGRKMRAILNPLSAHADLCVDARGATPLSQRIVFRELLI